MSSHTTSDLASNRKARYEFELLETYEAGMVLVGSEIKALRNHGATLLDAYVSIDKGEAHLKGCFIAPYSFSGAYNHEEKRVRKLLLHRKEIEKLKKAIAQKGLTIVPLSIYLKKGRDKLKIALARGKKHHDKRASIKEREDKRQIARIVKNQ
jgi:SsrA-binding protein